MWFLLLSSTQALVFILFGVVYHDCTWLYLTVPYSTELYLAFPSLHLSLPSCTSVYHILQQDGSLRYLFDTKHKYIPFSEGYSLAHETLTPNGIVPTGWGVVHPSGAKSIYAHFNNTTACKSSSTNCCSVGINTGHRRCHHQGHRMAIAICPVHPN